MEKYIKAILVAFLFLVMQGIIGIVVTLAVIIIVPELREAALSHDYDKIMSTSVLAISSIMSGLFTCIAIHLLGVTKIKTCFSIKNVNWRLCAIAIISSLSIAMASDIISEFLKLDDYNEKIFPIIANSIIGALAIAVIGPIVEEFIFREGIAGYLLRKGVKPINAIIFSGFLFSLIHMNPAQIPFAFIMGITLAVAYYKTGSIIVPSIIHIINNSIGVILMLIYGEKANDITVTDSFGTAGAIIMLIIFAVLGILGLYYFWEKHPTPEHKNEDLEFVY